MIVAPVGLPVERAARPSPWSRAGGPILAATDVSPASNAAIRTAWQLAGCTNADVQIISVVTPAAFSLSAEEGSPLRLATSAPSRRAVRTAAVREQLGMLVDDRDAWPIEIVEGEPAPAIARAARLGGARMIVLGLGRHAAVDRFLGSETALEVIRLADAPVLAVAATATGLPRRVVAAVDFSASGLNAIRVALQIMRRPGTLYLAHAVRPLDASGESLESSGSDGTPLALAFDEVKTAIGAPEEIDVEPMMLRGAPAQALLDLASGSGADLIVAGTHGARSVQRLFVGSVATRLVRGASCSVLVVPRAAWWIQPGSPS